MYNSTQPYYERALVADIRIRSRVVNAAPRLEPGQGRELFIPLNKYIFSDQELFRFEQGADELFNGILPPTIDRAEIDFVETPVIAAKVLLARSFDHEFFNQAEH